MERELMTVKAFAEAAGITTQRVYQLTKSTLKEYTMTIAKGKKCIVMVYKDGLELINCKDLQSTCKDLQREQTAQQSDTGDFLGGGPCKDLQSTCKEDIATAEALDVLRAELEAYRDQLKTKDDQIAQLQSHIQQQQQTINTLSDAVTSALNQQQALNAAAAVIQKQLIDGAAEASKDTGAGTSSTGTATATPSADGTPSAGAADNKQRRGIFGALDTIRAKFKR